MSQCVNDHTLWLLSEGQASRQTRTHVAGCAGCAARYQRLVNDLEVLKSALSVSPPQVAALRQRLARRGWLTATAAAAAMLWLAWSGLWLLAPSPAVIPQERGQEAVWSFLEGVSEALFATVDVGAVETLDRPFDLADLQAALAGAWPCEGEGTVWRLECDDDAFPLFFGAD